MKRWLWATRSNGIDAEDLIQAGQAGLARAAQKFNPTLGIQFNTYGMYWARAFIKAEALGMARTVRVPELEALTAHRAGRPYPIMSVSLDGTSFGPVERARAEEMVPEPEDEEEPKNLVALAMAKMPPRERSVLHMRFFRDMTLQEVGAELKVSRERARQLETRGLAMMQRLMPAEQ